MSPLAEGMVLCLAMTPTHGHDGAVGVLGQSTERDVREVTMTPDLPYISPLMDVASLAPGSSAVIVAETIIFFTVISVGGWIYETLLCLVMERRLVRRGVLYGPCCPIYGVGATCVWLCLGWIESPVGVFVAGAILATSIEYATGTFLVHRFHRSWWDYSMFRFNYRGRICLAASLVFGFFSLLIVLFLQPLIFGGLEMLTEATLIDAASFLVICYATDVVATTLSLDARARERVLGVARRIRDIT